MWKVCCILCLCLCACLINSLSFCPSVACCCESMRAVVCTCIKYVHIALISYAYILLSHNIGYSKGMKIPNTKSQTIQLLQNTAVRNTKSNDTTICLELRNNGIKYWEQNIPKFV